MGGGGCQHSSAFRLKMNHTRLSPSLSRSVNQSNNQATKLVGWKSSKQPGNKEIFGTNPQTTLQRMTPWTNHINVQCSWLCEYVMSIILCIPKVKALNNCASIFTKEMMSEQFVGRDKLLWVGNYSTERESYTRMFKPTVTCPYVYQLFNVLALWAVFILLFWCMSAFASTSALFYLPGSYYVILQHLFMVTLHYWTIVSISWNYDRTTLDDTTRLNWLFESKSMNS